MKASKTRAVSFFLTTALFLSALLPSGCSNNQNDISEIEDLTARFIASVGTGDEDAVNALVEGDFVPDYADMNYLISSDLDYDDIMKAVISKTQILSYENIETNRRKHEASATIKVSAIDVDAFCSSHTGDMMTVAEYAESVDSINARISYNVSLDYVFDEGENCWLVKNSSATEFMDCFDPAKTDHLYFLDLAFFSAEEANEIFKEIYEGFAQGQFEQPLYTLSMNDMRVFDMHFYNDEIVYEAAEKFSKAYFKYIVDHGIEVETKDIKNDSNLYSATLKGTAPSVKSMFEFLTSDEYVIETDKTLLRLTYIDYDTSSEEKWNQTIAKLYSDLAELIPDLDGDDFEVEFAIDRSMPVPEQAFAELPLKISREDLVDKPSIPFKQNNKCIKKAINELADELPEEWYDYLTYYADKGLYVPNDLIYSTTKDVEWEGTDEYPNQAVNVIESIPDFSEGNIMYGDSQPDDEGISIHYSKEPGWLNTAGYCVTEDAVFYMLLFDHKFDKGTVLEYDWTIDGNEYGSTKNVTVEEDGKDSFGISIPSSVFETADTCEFRLWEEGHTHVIGYVKLTKT